MKKVDNEYYLELKDVLNNTLYTEMDLSRVFGDGLEKAMKILSQEIYTLIYARYVGAYMDDHIKFMQNRIDKDQKYLKRAMIEHVKGAMESGMDLNSYLDQPKDKFPSTVYQELRIGFLLDPSRKLNSNET